jgi:hypothetical protein
MRLPAPRSAPLKETLAATQMSHRARCAMHYGLFLFGSRLGCRQFDSVDQRRIIRVYFELC